MKKVIKLIAVLILLMTTAPVFASSTTFHVYAIGDKKFNVQVSNIQGRAVSYIKDDNGQVLFERKLKGEGALNVTFDISSLENGAYLFVIEDEAKRQSVPFELAKGEVRINKENTKRTNFPQLVKGEEAVLVKLLSDETNDLHIDIKSEDGQLLFQEKIDGKLGLIGKRFKFQPGEYLVTITSNDFSETRYLAFK